MYASRCPKCHGVVPESYWLKVEAREKAAAAREAARHAEEEARKAKEREEWIRKEPERRAAAAAQAATEAVEASKRKQRKRGWNISLALSATYLLALVYFVVEPQREAHLRA
jgi:hypothetical protein